MASAPCPVCAAQAFEAWTRLRATDVDECFDIERCRACRFLRTAGPPADLSPYYATGLAATMTTPGNALFDRLRGARLRRELRSIEALRGDRTLLDLGCGTGALSLAAHDLQIPVVAADQAEARPAAIVSQSAIAYRAFDFERLAFAAPLPEGDYLAVLRHVLEHARDPREMLEALLGQGIDAFYIVVPNHDSMERRLFGRSWYLWDPPRHLSHFSLETLTRLIEGLGLEVVSAGTATAPTLLPDVYRWLRTHGASEAVCAPLGPNGLLTALASPLSVLLPGNACFVQARSPVEGRVSGPGEVGRRFV